MYGNLVNRDIAAYATAQDLVDVARFPLHRKAHVVMFLEILDEILFRQNVHPPFVAAMPAFDREMRRVHLEIIAQTPALNTLVFVDTKRRRFGYLRFSV